jgi:hypothetical protein
MHRLKLLYPFLFAPLWVLNSIAHNTPGAYSIGELFGFVAVLLMGTGLLYAALYLVLHRIWAVERIALLVMTAVLWFWVYVPLYGWTRGFIPLGPRRTHALLLALVCGATLGALALGRRPPVLRRLTTFFAVMGGLLVGWSGVAIAEQQLLNWRAIHDSELVRELGVPIPVSPEAARLPRRDIYLILLDRYADSAVLREALGFENGAILDSLRSLGFTIPRLVRSNYDETYFSLPSLLNFSFITLEGAQTALPNYLVVHNRAFSFIKAQGYRLVFFASRWWSPTLDNPAADLVLPVEDRWSADQVLTCSYSQLARAFIKNTPLKFTSLCHPERDARYVRETFKEMEELSGAARPSFVFAHVLSPHGPYVLDRRCDTHFAREGAPQRHDRYVEQVQCVNHLVLTLVRGLLARSRVPPIILLEGDHGLPYHDPRYPDPRYPNPERLPPNLLRRRFGTFGAYYLPGASRQVLGDSISLVNVLPKVFNHYFGIHLPMLPDRMYMWQFDRAGESRGNGRLHGVDPHLLDQAQ